MIIRSKITERDNPPLAISVRHSMSSLPAKL
jgi:hypothetical protein